MPTKDQLLAIRVFSRIVETGSFTKAANSLNLPKTTVTKLIRGLEQHLRIQLLQRTTRRVSVTNEGNIYYGKALKLVNELEDLDLSFSAMRNRPRGHLRIDMAASTAQQLVIPMLPEFLELYPDIRMDLSISDRPVDMIGDNVDCAIRGGTLTGASIIRRSIGAAPWVTCAAPTYLKNHAKPRHPKDLRTGHRMASYISPRSARPMPLRFSKGMQRVEINCARTLGVNDAATHLAAGIAGIGIIQTLLPLAKSHVKSGQLMPMLLDWQPAPYPFYVVYPSNRYPNSRLRVFIDWLSARFSERISAPLASDRE